ncbi:Lrp/AsnC family transcriptional regulator [Novosphingobium sp.]|uniref:Lrp/AsnC family transcriptional regulator n=1 Tax=Novosphingobium sp. TaxID=1874826 RepID=UPI003B523481
MTIAFPATDPLDRAIAVLLARDARTSFRQIATEAGVTEGTVRARVKRLQAAGLLRLEPIVDLAGDGAEPAQQMVFITMRCHAGQLDTVRDALLAIRQVEALYDANAAHRLVAICVVKSLAEVAEVTNRVFALPGVRDADSEIVLQTIKYNAAIGPIATRETLVDSGL